MASSTGLSSNLLESVFNHLTLPARLPGARDPPDIIARELVDRLIIATRDMRDVSKDKLYRDLDFVTNFSKFTSE